jgi:quinol monooxygenase YgiN
MFFVSETILSIGSISRRSRMEIIMYGTIARMRVKPGKEAEFVAFSRDRENSRSVPGSVNTYVYRMDADPNEYYLVAVFESRDAYVANANSPDQDAEYRKLLELLEGAPEWHDGEVVYSEK